MKCSSQLVKLAFYYKQNLPHRTPLDRGLTTSTATKMLLERHFLCLSKAFLVFGNVNPRDVLQWPDFHPLSPLSHRPVIFQRYLPCHQPIINLNIRHLPRNSPSSLSSLQLHRLKGFSGTSLQSMFSPSPALYLFPSFTHRTLLFHMF